jgi:hypothetical protein
MFFRPKPSELVPASTTQWQAETFEWLLRNTGGIELFRQTTLILPTDEFFPDRGLRGEEGAKVLFERVRIWAGMPEWPCELRAMSSAPADPISELSFETEAEVDAGGFSVSAAPDSIPIITYDSRLCDEPMALIATFAHELAHYLCATFPDGPPGGDEMLEPATDMAAVFMGFGVFLANSAFSFRQFSQAGQQGWRAQRRGYLSELELLNGIAIYCSVLGISWRDAEPHLDAHLRPLMKQAAKDIGGRADLVMRNG